MAGMCRLSPIILILLLVASTYGGPWRKPVPAAIVASSSSAEMVDMIPQLRIELSIDNCTVNGKFPIPESCKDFYQCDDWDGLGMEMYHFTCPVGTIFDDHVSTCNFPPLVKSRPECTSGEEVQGNAVEEAIHLNIVHAGYEMESVDLATGNDYALRELMLNTFHDRTKRSAIIEEDYFTEENNVTEEIDFTEDILVEEDNITAECKGNITEESNNIIEEGNNITDSDSVAKNALQSCKQIYNVDQYVNMVTSMIPVFYPAYLKAESYLSYYHAIDKYNKVLEEAQNHTEIWRYGNSIKNDFRRIYELAKLFGPSFQRKYVIAERKLKTVEKSIEVIKLINDTREDIQIIQSDIDKYLEMIKLQPSFFEIFKTLIAEKETQIADKRRKLRKLMSSEKDLDEVVAFLVSVKNDAGAIKERADVTKEKLLAFRDNTLQDKTAFIQSKTFAERAINDSVAEVAQIEESIKQINAKIKKEEKISEEHKTSIAKSWAVIDAELNEMKAFTQYYNREMAEESSKGWFQKAFRTLFGGKSVSHLPEALENNQKLLDSKITIYTNRSKETGTKLDKITKLIYDLEAKVLESGSKQKNIKFVTYFLLTVIEDSGKILTYIDRAIYGLNKLTHTFEGIAFKLESLIHTAREMQEPAEKRDFESLFFVDMSTMQTNWNNSYSDIIDIGSCTDPDYYAALVERIKDAEPPIYNTSITELNCTPVIELLTINDTTITPTTPPPTTTITTEQSLIYIDFDFDAENFI